MTCLGCGGVTCQVCEDKTRCLVALSHWPLEVSVSRAALGAIEELIRDEIADGDPIGSELKNLGSIIRAHLQHDSAPTFSVGPVETFLLEQAGKHCGSAKAELFLKAATMVAGRESTRAVSTEEDASWLG